MQIAGQRAVIIIQFTLLPITIIATGAWQHRCQADLVNPGDLAFIGINSDNPDAFAVVLLADAAATDVVYLNDNEWVDSDGDSVGDQFNGTMEGEASWTIGTALAAGTVVTFSNLDTTPVASVGTLSGDPLSLENSDTIFAFLGTDATSPTTFLAAISTKSADYNGLPISGTLTGTGLTQGQTAVLLPDSTNGGQYTGPRSGAMDFSDYHSSIGDPASNWMVASSNGQQFVPFNATAFSAVNATASTPEPASLGLMLIALMLGVVGHRCARRMSKAAALSHDW